MIESGRWLWNAGIFLGRAKDFVAAFEAHAGDLVEPVRAAVARARPDLGFLRLREEDWAAARAVSIDYAVMERAENLSVVALETDWSDLGDWTAIWRAQGPDAAGLVTIGNAEGLDCADTLLRAEGEGVELVGIGLEGMIAVATPDAVVVAPKGRSQEVRRAVDALKARGRPQATEFPRDNRPWGWFETVARGNRHQVKRIVVKPGAALSLQSHVHRAEHWIVVAGTAKVTIGEEVRMISENEFDLRAARGGSSAGEPGQGGTARDRGADRGVSGRG